VKRRGSRHLGRDDSQGQPKAWKAMKSPFYTAEHDAFRAVMRRFVE
jgi:acyl-CoA dehydrogenase